MSRPGDDTRAKCDNCRFYWPISFECRRHAPVKIDGNASASFPTICGLDWCGDHEPIPPGQEGPG